MDSKTETVSDREIAKFMNINLTLGFDVFWIVDEEGEMPDYINGTVYSPSTNWNQLMAVVEKIEELHDASYLCRIVSRRCIIYDSNIADQASVYQGSGTGIISAFLNQESKQIACYKAAVEFIKWYNNSQSPDTIK